MPHTPGPWSSEYLTVYRVAADEGPEFIAEVESGLAADVDLIAAAPDLLAALKALRSHPVNEKNRTAAKDAILKAEGRSS